MFAKVLSEILLSAVFLYTEENDIIFKVILFREINNDIGGLKGM